MCVGISFESERIAYGPTHELKAMTAAIVSPLGNPRSEAALAIIFSSRDGYVWASWQATDVSIRLGRHDMVAAMMRDFLAQDALGERLAMHLPGGD